MENVPVPEISEETVEVVEPCDKKISQESIVEQITDVPATGEQIVSVPVPVMFEEIVDVAKLFSLGVPQKGIFERTCKRIMDVPAHQVMKEIVEVFELIPQERVKQCTVKLTDDQNKQQLQDNQQQ